MQFKSYIKKVSIDKAISPQLALQSFMLECLLIRISGSKYKTNLILKGIFVIHNSGIEFKNDNEYRYNFERDQIN